jgi:hypothetical protein
MTIDTPLRLVQLVVSIGWRKRKQVPRLRKIVRLANDLSSLGMTGVFAATGSGVTAD